MPDSEPKIPPQLQPSPDRYRFDLDRALSAVVGLSARVPEEASSASALGTSRAGSGVLIGADGLILTVSYLVADAETIWVTLPDGRGVPAQVVGIDHATGFALIQALRRGLPPPLPLGDSRAVAIGDPLLFAAAGGRQRAIETRVVGREVFAGYWEYVLDNAIFSAPAHPFWGGGALIDRDGALVGIGSLVLQHADPQGRRLDMNMVVPIEFLRPIMADLLASGRSRTSPRPWVGLFCNEADGGLHVRGLIDNGPAEQAGLRPGDRILKVNDVEVSSLAELWRTIWQAGDPGVEIEFNVHRGPHLVQLSVTSVDRNDLPKRPRLN